MEHVAVLLDTCFIASDINLLLAPCLRRKHIWCGLCQIALVNIGTIRRLIVAIDIKAIGSHKLIPRMGRIIPLEQPEAIETAAIGTLAKLLMRGRRSEAHYLKLDFVVLFEGITYEIGTGSWLALELLYRCGKRERASLLLRGLRLVGLTAH